MTGRFYIDGKNAYATYGVFVTQGGYNDLLCFPALKKAASVDWPDEDGAQVDLSSPALDCKRVSIHFAVHDKMKLGAFIELLSDGAYHVFDMKELKRSFKLRMVSQPNFMHRPKLELFTLEFSDDFPLEGYDYSGPVPNADVWQQGYEIDGRTFSDYGIWILDGSDEQVMKSPDVKPALTRDINARSGVIYDDEHVRYRTKSVEIDCLMRMRSLPDFWRNYDAFLYDLVRPDERKLYVDLMGNEYPCYYKSCSVREFAVAGGRPWFSFAVTLEFLSFRVEADEYLLSTENGMWIIAEDGINVIDMEVCL